MITITIISVLSVLVVIFGFTTFNLLKKNEKQEDILVGYLEYLDRISKVIEASDKKLKEIDHCEVFKSDDEVIQTDDLQGMESAGSDELRTMQQLTAMGFKMEDSLNAIKAINSTDLTAVIDYLTSKEYQGTFW